MAQKESDKDRNQRLACQVMAYWRGAGHTVHVTQYLAHADKGTWGMASNLINGLPPTYQNGDLHYVRSHSHSRRVAAPARFGVR